MEPIIHITEGVGWIEVVTGCMCSGKTEELVRRIRRALIAKHKVQVFKPAKDDRDGLDKIKSRGGGEVQAMAVKQVEELLGLVEHDTGVVAIDEAQFFLSSPDSLRITCDALADQGKRVLVCGLDQDFKGEPFKPIALLMASAESVTKLFALCMVCGQPAHRSVRVSGGQERLVVGSNQYEARCRLHSRV